MTKVHDLHHTNANYETINYFYIREKNDRNGNPRYRVFIIDPDGAVYETVFKCYESQIESRLHRFIEDGEKKLYIGRYIGRDQHNRPIFKIIRRL